MERQDDNKLWDILGRVPEPKLSPFFTRNVLRKISQDATRFERARNWFSLRRLVAASAVAVVVVGMAIATNDPVYQSASANDSDEMAKTTPKDYHDVDGMDQL